MPLCCCLKQQQPSVVVVLTAVALLVLVLCCCRFCSPPSKCSFSGHRSQAARFALISRCYCMLLCGTVAPHSRLVCARVLHICSVKRTWQRCSSCTHRSRGPLLSRHNQGRLVCVHALCFLLCCLRSLRENTANANTPAQQQHVATCCSRTLQQRSVVVVSTSSAGFAHAVYYYMNPSHHRRGVCARACFDLLLVVGQH